MKKQFIFLFALLALISCQKEITIDLPEVEKRIVVDGGIFIGQYAEINLTWSTGYFDPVDSASLASYLISNAVATVTDGAIVDTLHISYNPYKPIPIVWKGNTIIGQVGHTYVLSVTAEGKTVTATTTIPTPIPLDSAWFKVEPGQDSLGFAWAHLTDPNGIGNAYRWYAKRLHEDSTFLAPYGSAFDDRFVEAKSFDFGYNRPFNPAADAPEEIDGERGYYKIGDIIVLQFCTIGQREVNFFRTFETEVGNNGNPFAAPGVIETNIDGGLGIWCGYAQVYDTVVCQ